jgi:hypothetical protein
VDKDYRPAPRQAVAFQVELITSDGDVADGKGRPANRSRAAPAAVYEKALVTDESGQAAIEPASLPPGAYRVVARAQVADRAVVAEDVFIVNPEREELEHPEARADVLAAVAQATGGRALGSASALPDDLALTPPRVVRVDRRSDIEVWSQPHLFLLAMAFLGAEWALRRRRGFL